MSYPRRNLRSAALLLAPLLLSLTHIGAQQAAVSNADLISFVDKRVLEVQPTPEEKRLDEIAWVKDIREALRLSQESGRPVFLFTHDGRINTGRC